MKLVNSYVRYALPLFCSLTILQFVPYQRLLADQGSYENVTAFSLEKLEDTPDLMQSLPQAGLPWGGLAHCGPVAASNSIVWLAKHGFDQLLVPFEATAAGQGKLARLLGSKKYMHTTEHNGTDVDNFKRGI